MNSWINYILAKPIIRLVKVRMDLISLKVKVLENLGILKILSFKMEKNVLKKFKN